MRVRKIRLRALRRLSGVNGGGGGRGSYRQHRVILCGSLNEISWQFVPWKAASCHRYILLLCLLLPRSPSASRRLKYRCAITTA